MANIVILTVALILCIYEIDAQMFGGRTPFAGGGFNQQVGVKAGPAWGSLSQNFDKRGFSDPITVGAGTGFTSNKGHGLSGQVLHQPGIGGQGNIRGQLGLINNDRNQLNAWAQHDRSLDKNLKTIGPATNSAGIRFDNAGGANAFLSGSKTQGLPARGTVGGNVPLYNSKDGLSNLNLGGQTTFGHGMKPDHQVGIQFEKKF